VKKKNLFEETPQHCRQITVRKPVISNKALAKIRECQLDDLKSKTISILFNPQMKGGLKSAMDRIQSEASEAISDGASILILSDRGIDTVNAPIPSLLATSGVHHHLIRNGTRTKIGLVVETGEAREVAHFSLLIGFGAGAINPYLAFETLHDQIEKGEFASDISAEKAEGNYLDASHKGILKTMSKMGISTIQSYRGAQIFEAVGLNEKLVNKYFTSTPSRIGGIGIEELELEAILRHQSGYSQT